APAASAADQVSSYVVDGMVNADGSLAVKATMTFDGAAPNAIEQRLATTTRTADDFEYRYRVTDIVATAGATALDAKVTIGSDTTTINIATGGSSEPVTLTYVVHGAAIATDGGTTTLRWPLLQGLNIPVATFDATVTVPGMFTVIDCAAGAPATPGACTSYSGGTSDSPNPVFHDEGRAAGDVVIATVRFPTGVVAVNQDLRELWTLDRAFSAEPLPLGLAAGLLLLGGLALWAAHRRLGSDAGVGLQPTPVAEFHPIGPGQSEFRVLDGIRPGEIGTVVDERVDPIDVTATLLDLSVRGHLRITELAPGAAHAATDWTFSRRASDDPLLTFERTLLDAVAPVQGEPVKVSNLAGSVGTVIGQIQSELYDEVVARGWFARRPDSTRNQWNLIGWVGLGVAVLATVLLAAFTRFGLLGLALVALALGVLFVAQEMPARTAAGTALLGGLNALRGSLLTQPVDTLPAGQGLTQLSSILPYAIVVGGKDRWLQAVVSADDDAGEDSTDLDWYHGPAGWHLENLPASLGNFITTVQGTLFSR
ncbi:MAG: DUF2207 domain-containing protein, partial [Umezawaea sp.]